MKLNKVKLLTGLVILLLLINIGTIAGIWKLIDPSTLKLMPAPPIGAKEFIITKLDLNEEQQKVFEQLREEHFEEMKKLQANISNEKEAMYNMLKSENPDTTLTFIHIAKVMQNEERLERITFEHFRKVRAICNDEQKQHFDVILDQIMKMVIRPKGIRESVNPSLNDQRQDMPLP